MKIKKILILCFCIVFCILFTGCAAIVSTDNVEKEFNQLIKYNDYVSPCPDTARSAYGIYEWVSPDGVHYWVINDYYKYGITPRYDSDGNLIIDN